MDQIKDLLTEYVPQLPSEQQDVAIYATAAVGVGLVGAALLSPQKNPPTTYRDNTPDELQPAPKRTTTVSTWDADGKTTILKSKSGVGAADPETVMEVFEKAVEKHGSSTAFTHEQEQPDGSYVDRSWTWQEYYDDAKTCASAFIACGLEAYGSVGILGFNSPEWILADIGAILAGAKAAGIYTTNKADSCQYICEHSKATVVVLEGLKQFKKFQDIIDNKIEGGLPDLKSVVVYNDLGCKLPKKLGKSVNVYTWDAFMKLGTSASTKTLTKRMKNQVANECCTLIYTSGTTGRPKAVMISHDNCTWTTKAMLGSMQRSLPFGETPGGEHVVSYLPLSHIAAQILDIHGPMFMTALGTYPTTVHFARPTALKGTLGDTLKKCRPTIFFGVPRVWEKIQEKMVAKGRGNSALKKVIVAQCRAVGTKWHEACQVGGSGYKPTGFGLANGIAFKNVKKAIGLDRVKVCVTGAAPIAPATMQFYGSLGIHIMEVYGMSESTGPHTLGLPDYFKVGTVGPNIMGTETKIFPDGEICFRGRHIMMGYLYNEAKTRETIDREGWLHSGDIGVLDPVTRLLKITGRKKEIIITAGGENIAPVPVEDTIKEFCSVVSNCVMIGDKKKYCTALITLKTKQNEDGTFSDELAGDAALVNPDVKTVGDAISDGTIPKMIEDAIKRYNKDTKRCRARASQLQYFKILPTDFSPVGDMPELTATMKMMRPKIHAKYADDISAMYKKGYDNMKQA